MATRTVLQSVCFDCRTRSLPVEINQILPTICHLKTVSACRRYFVLSMPRHKATPDTSKTKRSLKKKQKMPFQSGASGSAGHGAGGGKTDDDEKYTFFYKKSLFSQFYPANFIVDSVGYVHAEQYMMHQKAVLFGDDQIADQILQESKPQAIKKLGRKVKNFDDLIWKENRLSIVKKGSYAKFSQNLDLKKQLLLTEGSILVEASPGDTIWGIGLAANNPKAKTKETWRGTNLLGYTLTEVGDQLMQEGSANETD